MHLSNARDTKTQTVSVGGIRRGDVITVRGRSCAVVDLRDIGLTHKLLQLANGTTHLLTRSQTIQVTRLHDVPTGHRTP
jgi:hypothetical protein